MTVTTRIATGSGLLVLLMAGVLAYHIDRGKKSAEVSEKLGASNLPAAALLSEQEERFEELEKLVSRFLARQEVEPLDSDYLRRGVEPLNDEVQTAFSDLNRLTLSVAEKSSLATLEGRWQSYLEAHQAAASQNAGLEPDQALPLWEPVRAGLKALGGDARKLRRQLETASRQQASRSTGEVEKAEAVSWGVVALALGLGVVVVVATARSIKRPLHRLIEATKAVALGKFSYQLDLGRDQEFAPLAQSFNHMVRRLSELDQMKKDFVAHVSHELKNPLVAMQETNQALSDELAGPLNERQKRLLALNIESGRRLSAMLSNLLDLSSLEAGAMSCDLKTTEVAALVRFAASEFEARAREQRIRLVVNLPTEGLWAPCDRDRVIQVLENLLDNAIKFSPAGSSLELSATASHGLPAEIPAALRKRLGGSGPARSWVLIRLADQGPGVPDNQKQAIFRRFHQVGHNSRTHRGGVGLGLAICRELVEAHEGAIWVNDVRPQGSVFTVALPAGATAGEGET